MRTNLNIESNKLSNGSITLEESFNDYPRLTLIEYTSNINTRAIGSAYTFGNLVFMLEGFTMNVNPLNIQNKLNEVTYNYIHVSKKLLEYPINVKNFVDTNKNNIVKKTEDTYYFSIGTLVSYVKTKVGDYVSINVPGFLVPLQKTPSVEEVITLKDSIDNRYSILGYIYKFEQKSVGYTSIGKAGIIKATAVSNINIGYNSVPSYKNTILNWSKKDNYDNDLIIKKYIQIKDSEYITYEGSYEPHLPPAQSKDLTRYPRDLSIMFDNSGDTKSCKITKYKWGQPDTEINAVFGFAHSALELVDDPEKPNTSTTALLDSLTADVVASGNALQEILKVIQSGKYGYPDDNGFNKEIVWRLISIKETKYIYENFSSNIKPQIKNEDGTLKSVIVPEEYTSLLNSNLQVLVREETNGWEIGRFAQEDPSNWAEGSIAKWINLKAISNLKDTLVSNNSLTLKQYYWMLYLAKVSLEQYLYRKIPIWERVDYAVEPYTKYYKDLDTVDWEVKYIPQNQLDKGSSDETPVPVLFPDPNWIPELMVSARSRLKVSVGLNGNPNYKLYDRNYYGSNPITVTTGSDEYEFIKYGILPSKNTRENLADLYSSYSNINSIVSAIESGINEEGTYYKPHLYMDVSDYGIQGNTIKEISLDAIDANFPSITTTKDDQFTTLTLNRVAQDHSYKSYITNSSYNLSDGRPPRATVRKPVYEEVKNDKNNPYTNSITYITASVVNSLNDYLPNLNIPSAENIQEALTGARFKLILDILNSGSTISAQLSYVNYVGKSMINSTINFPGITGKWIIKKASQTVQFSNDVSFVQPVNIEAGNYMSDISLDYKTVQESNVNKDSESISILINPDLPSVFGTPIDSIPSNFSRWLDID